MSGEEVQSNTEPSLTPDQRLQYVHEIVGYGNAETKNLRLAIIGFEEGGKQWGDNPGENDRRLKQMHASAANTGFMKQDSWVSSWQSDRFGTTEQMQCYIGLCFRKLLDPDFRDIDVRTYRIRTYRKRYCWQGFEVTGNYYAMAKPHKGDDFKPKALEYFGFKANSDVYEKLDVRMGARLALLKELWRKLADNRGYIILMGLDDNQVEEFFSQVSALPLQLDPAGDFSGYTFDNTKYSRWRRLQIYDSSPVVIRVQHPSGGWCTKSVVREMVNRLNKFR